MGTADNLLVDLSSKQLLDSLVVCQSALPSRNDHDADGDSFWQLAVEHLQVIDGDVVQKLQHTPQFQEYFPTRLPLHLDLGGLVSVLNR